MHLFILMLFTDVLNTHFFAENLSLLYLIVPIRLKCYTEQTKLKRKSDDYLMGKVSKKIFQRSY